jgi:hypothetical protein
VLLCPELLDPPLVHALNVKAKELASAAAMKKRRDLVISDSINRGMPSPTGDCLIRYNARKMRSCCDLGNDRRLRRRLD